MDVLLHRGLGQAQLPRNFLVGEEGRQAQAFLLARRQGGEHKFACSSMEDKANTRWRRQLVAAGRPPGKPIANGNRSGVGVERLIVDNGAPGNVSRLRHLSVGGSEFRPDHTCRTAVRARPQIPISWWFRRHAPDTRGQDIYAWSGLPGGRFGVVGVSADACLESTRHLRRALRNGDRSHLSTQQPEHQQPRFKSQARAVQGCLPTGSGRIRTRLSRPPGGRRRACPASTTGSA